MKTHLLFRRNGEDNWRTLGPVHLAWILQAMPGVDPKPPDGDGTERSPWRMASIEQWAGAAQQSIATPQKLPTVSAKLPPEEIVAQLKKQQAHRDLYIVGGHLLERNPSTGGYANYVTDVADALAVGKAGPTGVSTLGRPRVFPQPNRQDPTPIYAIKYRRLADSSEYSLSSTNPLLAMQARLLLWGEQDMRYMRSDELPGTVAALFISEVAREARMLPLGLMLLDLIEAGVSYGKAKKYTWETLMTKPGADNKTARVSGGKHPMLHDGTQAEAAQMFSTFNEVTRKSISILVAWLTVRLGQTASGAWKVAAGKADQKPTDKLGGALKQKAIQAPKTEPKRPTDSSEAFAFYHGAILPELKRRAETLACLLNDDSKVNYAG